MTREDLISLLREIEMNTIEKFAQIIIAHIQNGGKLMICGNGGSAAQAQHMATELVGRFLLDRRPYAVLSLTTDTSNLTAIGNDYGFDDIFLRQVIALGRPGDVLLGLSTSGNSRNVYKALEYAKNNGINTLALLGKPGSAIQKLIADYILVNHTQSPRIQECHLYIIHEICRIVEASLECVKFKNK